MELNGSSMANAKKPLPFIPFSHPPLIFIPSSNILYLFNKEILTVQPNYKIMKNILIIFGLLLCSPIFSQEKEQPISETERLVDKYGRQIVESFNNFAAKALPIAEDAFKIVVRLQIAKGLAGLIPVIVAIILWSIHWKEEKRIRAILDSGNIPPYMAAYKGVWDEGNITFKLIFTIISSCLFTILSMYQLPPAIYRLLAPEWYAIKEIIELF